MGAMPITEQHFAYAAALPVWLRHCDVQCAEGSVATFSFESPRACLRGYRAGL